MAATPRRFDKATGGWTDGEPIFQRCTAWRKLAENIAESLQRGTRVIVNGRLRSSTFEDREGHKRTSLELDVDEVGVSLQFGTMTFAKAERTSGRSMASSGAGHEDDEERGDEDEERAPHDAAGEAVPEGARRGRLRIPGW